MMNRKFLRTNLHPALMLSFLLVGLTGILLLLHLDFRGIKHLHQWMSVLFLLLCFLHLFLNWKVFLAQFKNGPVVLSLVGIGLLSLLLLFSAGDRGKKGHLGPSGGGHFRHIR